MCAVRFPSAPLQQQPDAWDCDQLRRCSSRRGSRAGQNDASLLIAALRLCGSRRIRTPVGYHKRLDRRLNREPSACDEIGRFESDHGNAANGSQHTPANPRGRAPSCFASPCARVRGFPAGCCGPDSQHWGRLKQPPPRSYG